MRSLLVALAALGVVATRAPAAGLAPVVVIEAFRATEATVPVHRGLGFITESDGFLLTSYANLIDPANGRLLDDLRVRLATGDIAPAAIIGVEPTINLGILKIEINRALPTAKFSRDHGLAGSLALSGVGPAVGGGFVTIPGHVVAMNTKECYQESLTSTMVRAEIDLPADAVGGPVFDPDGYLVAIHTGYQPPDVAGEHVEAKNETHLLPAVLAYNVYASIKAKQSLRSPWTGFSVRPLRDAERLRLAGRKRFRTGIGIEFVWPGGPAEKLGIRPDDLLAQFGHYPITSVADFQKWLYMYGVGQRVKLVLIRDGRTFEVDFVIEERPASARPR